jgi:phage-related protein
VELFRYLKSGLHTLIQRLLLPRQLTGHARCGIISPAHERKHLVWVGSCRKDHQAFPPPVQHVVGYALHIAQIRGRHPTAKTLKGLQGTGVVEIIEDYDGDTFRLVYTVRLKERIYALHAFQKKSRLGISTPKKELDLSERRLREAEAIHQRWLESEGRGQHDDKEDAVS